MQRTLLAYEAREGPVIHMCIIQIRNQVQEDAVVKLFLSLCISSCVFWWLHSTHLGAGALGISFVHPCDEVLQAEAFV